MTTAITVGCGLALLSGGSALAQGMGGPGDGDFGRGRFGGRMGGHRGWLRLAIFLVILVGAILLTWWLARRRPTTAAAPGAPAAAPPSPTASAESILAERLARGEISPDDYRAARDALTSTISS